LFATILNSTQQPRSISVASFYPNFDQTASDKPFIYYSGLWLLLSHIILSQTCFRLGNDSIEDSEVDNRFEKKYILMQVSCSFFSFSPISSQTE